MNWTIDNIPDQRGRVCIVTGANTGLGLSDARALAGKGATVIMACRNVDKANAAAQNIRLTHPAADVRVSALDLASLASVRDFAQRFSGEHDRLDLLINNAGVMMPPRTITADGFELQFESNYLGHFLLTGLLLPLLLQTQAQFPGARVVSLSSVAHRFGKIDLDNLNVERGYSKIRAYAQSKLACLIYAVEMQRRLNKAGESLISVAAHPGATRTELARHGLVTTLALALAQPVDDGAMPTLRAATDANVRGGEYYGPGGFLTLRGPAVRETPRSTALDATVGARLWEVSQDMVKLAYL